MKKEILRMEHIYVKRRDKYALSDFKLNIYQDEFVILYGYAGSGIHELSEVLFGSREVDQGRLWVDGKEISGKKKWATEKQGVFWLKYENNLVPDLSVAENLFFGSKEKWFEMPVQKRMQERLAKDILKKFDVHLDVHQRAEKLDFYEEQIIRLIKAYAKGAKLVIIESSLEMLHMGKEVKLVDVIKKLREDGISILWLEQRIDTVPDMVDRIVIMRDGKNVRNIYCENYSKEMLVQVASARASEEEVIHYPDRRGNLLLSMKDVCASYIKNLNVDIYENQSVGIWSLEQEALRSFRNVILGEEMLRQGTMWFQNKPYAPASYEAAVKAGINLTDIMWYEKRVIQDLNVVDNMLLEQYWTQNHMFLPRNKKWERYVANKIRMRHKDLKMKRWRDLNNEQQWKLLLERCLYQSEKIHVITEPLMRYSYGMLHDIQNLFEELKHMGKTVIVMSANINDLKNICDEIVIIQNGTVKARIPREFFGEIEKNMYM